MGKFLASLGRDFNLKASQIQWECFHMLSLSFTLGKARTWWMWRMWEAACPSHYLPSGVSRLKVLCSLSPH